MHQWDSTWLLGCSRQCHRDKQTVPHLAPTDREHFVVLCTVLAPKLQPGCLVAPWGGMVFSSLQSLAKTTLLTHWGYFWVVCGVQLSSFIPVIPAQRDVVVSHGLHHPWAEVNICFHLKGNKKATGLGSWSGEDQVQPARWQLCTAGPRARFSPGFALHALAAKLFIIPV